MAAGWQQTHPRILSSLFCLGNRVTPPGIEPVNHPNPDGCLRALSRVSVLLWSCGFLGSPCAWQH